ncbi:MAG: hypothetical protein ACHP9T_09955 [Caulobacterales bacterium]|jgi:hypothetical protein
MLRTLENKIPAQVRKTDEGLATPRKRPKTGRQWRSTIGARNPLSVQGRIPLSTKRHTKPAKLTLAILKGSAQELFPNGFFAVIE